MQPRTLRNNSLVAMTAINERARALEDVHEVCKDDWIINCETENLFTAKTKGPTIIKK